MKNPLLVLHLIGAILLGISMLFAVIAMLLSNKSKAYLRNVAIIIAAQTGIQLISGSLLAFQKGAINSPLAFCRNILLYLTTVAILEIVLFRKLSFTSEKIPTKLVTVPIVFGVLTAIVALVIL